MDPLGGLKVTEQLLRSIAGIDEFKGSWLALGNLAPERLSALRRIATIESIGSSTRIEGVKLTDDEVEKLPSGLDIRSFRSRDEQEVAGYDEIMELIFESYHEIPLNENHIRQLHGVLLKYSEKDARHRGHYKSLPSSVEGVRRQRPQHRRNLRDCESLRYASIDARTRRLDSYGTRERTAPSPAGHQRLCCSLPGDPSISGRQRAAFASSLCPIASAE